MSSQKLLVRPSSQDKKADCRLICFPWAGAGASYYISWAKKFSPSIEVVALRPPGREIRFKEPNFRTLEEAVTQTTEAIVQNLLDKPFAFFGHSWGSLLSFSVAVRLKEKHGVEPIHMFVSSMSAPHSAQVQEKDKVTKKSNKEFLDFMKSLGGTPKEVLENEELMEMCLPSMRADYGLYEEFKYKLPPTPPLSCPLHVFDGKNDKKHDLDGWRQVTTGDTVCDMYPGGHFYFKDKANESKIIGQINTRLQDLIRLTDQPL
ncbi:S-acyl fatty acid synthase thioesterase, medium chain-like [Liolophura sinensis]|uniref:S-acyl fatty acid synthase thioesterase, medium chain-like n=1 Tax=Liolophura sinensis TaxID=3198878 RepID=UPI00315877CE